MNLLAISPAWYFFLLSLVFLLVLAIFSTLLFRLFKAIINSNFLGNNLAIKIINIAVTSLVFRSAINSLLIQPLISLLSLVKIYVVYITSGLKENSIRPAAVSNFLIEVYNAMANLLTKHLLRWDIFLAIAFAGALTLFINKIFYSTQDKEYKMPTVKGIYTLQQNLFLSVLMLLSLFLILSAMISIPFIGKKTFVNNNDYDSTLLRIKERSTASPYTFTLKDTSYLDSLKGKIELAKSINNWKRPATGNVLAPELELVSKYFNNQSTQIRRLVNEHNASIEAYEQSNTRNYDNISFKFKEKYSGLSFGSIEDYYGYLIRWYDNTVRRSLLYYKEEEKKIREYSEQLKMKAYEVKDNFKLYLDSLKTIDTIFVNNAKYYYPIDYFNLAGAPSYYDITFVRNYNLSDGPKLNAKRNLFASIGDWLVNTQSMDIVLIVGMFGFGLLGAAISTFITTTKASLMDTSTPLIQNLSVLMIRGFSAAIVIFLATKGSIAVINNGSNEPNPYVLFFACLVGAVFSDRIWDWAKAKISSGYDPNTGTASNAIKPKDDGS